MQKQTQLPFWLLGAAIATALFHNVFSATFSVEEPIFLMLTLILVLAFIITVVVNVATYTNKGKPQDIWKMGWLGLFGLMGIFAPGLYALFGFFAFFGVKKR